MKVVNGEVVYETAEDLAQIEADLAAWAAGAARREAERAEAASGMSRLMRDLVIAALPANHPRRQQAEAVEAKFAAAAIRKG
jgi:hypothetical protein